MQTLWLCLPSNNIRDFLSQQDNLNYISSSQVNIIISTFFLFHASLFSQPALVLITFLNPRRPCVLLHSKFQATSIMLHFPSLKNPIFRSITFLLPHLPILFLLPTLPLTMNKADNPVRLPSPSHSGSSCEQSEASCVLLQLQTPFPFTLHSLRGYTFRINHDSFPFLLVDKCLTMPTSPFITSWVRVLLPIWMPTLWFTNHLSQNHPGADQTGRLLGPSHIYTIWISEGLFGNTHLVGIPP